MSISSYFSDHSAASNPPSHEFSHSDPSRQSGMVQPVIQHSRDVCERARRRFVSSRFIRFMYNLRFDRPIAYKPCWAIVLYWGGGHYFCVLDLSGVHYNTITRLTRLLNSIFDVFRLPHSYQASKHVPPVKLGAQLNKAV
eukprot:scaffold21813_cov149-Isochrysis_galbana.AAC.1